MVRVFPGSWPNESSRLVADELADPQKACERQGKAKVCGTRGRVPAPQSALRLGRPGIPPGQVARNHRPRSCHDTPQWTSWRIEAPPVGHRGRTRSERLPEWPSSAESESRHPRPRAARDRSPRPSGWARSLCDHQKACERQHKAEGCIATPALPASRFVGNSLLSQSWIVDSDSRNPRGVLRCASRDIEGLRSPSLARTGRPALAHLGPLGFSLDF